MTDFRTWRTIGDLVSVGDHRSRVIESDDDASGIATAAASLPEAYAESDSLALIAERFAKRGVARFLRNKLPTKPSARSGDMGEILATASRPLAALRSPSVRGLGVNRRALSWGSAAGRNVSRTRMRENPMHASR